MKFAFTLSIVLAATLAQASPKIGDKSTHAISSSINGVSTTGTVTEELIAYDATTDTWTAVVDQVINGEASHNEYQVPGKDIWSSEKIQDQLKNCVEYEGIPEKVETPAGVLDACKFPVGSHEDES